MRPTNRWTSKLSAAAVVAAVLLASMPALAQSSPQTVVPSETQLELSDEGVRAMVEGDYAGAVARLERAVRLGEANVLYLNLGRAYQKLGRCRKAREALDKAKTAPPVEDPPADEVKGVAKRYLAELPAQCPDKTNSKTVAAPADDAEDSGGGGSAGLEEANDTAVASGDTAESQQAGASPDTSNTEAADQDSSTDQDGSTDQDSSTDQNGSTDQGAVTEADGVAAASVNAGPEAAEAGSNGLGWGTALTGVGLIGGGVALHFVAESDRSMVQDAAPNDAGRVTTITQAEAASIEDDADRLDTIGLAVGITGGVAAAVGTYLLVAPDDDSAGVAVGLTSEDVAVSWYGRF